MKWTLSLPEPAILVYYSAKIIGLAPFTLKNNRFYATCIGSQLYSVWLAVLYGAFTTRAVIILSKVLLSSALPLLLKICVMTYWVVELPISFLILMIISLKVDKVVDIMNKLGTISNELNSLGITMERDKFFRNLIVTTAVVNALIITACVALIFLETWPTVTMIEYSIRNFFLVTVLLAFTQTLFFIRQQFKVINENLHEGFKPVGNLRTVRHSRTFLRDRNHVIHVTDVERIRKIEALHLGLCNLVEETTRLVAIPIFLKIIQSTAELTAHCFWIYRVLHRSRKAGQTAESNYLVVNISTSLLRTAILICQLLLITYAPTKTCEEGNATRAALFKMWYKCKPRRLRDEFLMFSDQLEQRHVAVSVLGLIKLDYSFFYQISCTAIAYSTIMIQLDMSQH